MKFLVDAQLPKALSTWLNSRNHDSIHTLDLPDGNRTRDHEICHMAARENRIVVTKDGDFVQSFILHGLPPKLLLVSTGNLSNRELIALVQREIPNLEAAYASSSFIEINQAALIIHK